MSDPRSGRRQKRVASLIQDELGRVFVNNIQSQFDCLITVTRVEMPADLKTASVYLTVMGPPDPAPILDWLRQRAGHFRKILASAINLKYNPELFFILDPVPEYESRIDDLIARTKKSHEH